MNERYSMSVIMSINRFAGICGHFYNGEIGSGYNCNHPDCKEVQCGEGWCHSWACPFGCAPDNDDFISHGMKDFADPMHEDEGDSDYIRVWDLPEKDFDETSMWKKVDR